MNDEARKNLFDVLQAAEEITAFTRNMDFQSYRESTVTSADKPNPGTLERLTRHCSRTGKPI
jgi:hypothetical protein